MEKFVTGNVIRTRSGSLQIVSDTRTDYINTIFFDSSNSSAGHRKEDYQMDNCCYCGPDPDCPDCKGTGEYKTTIYGYIHFTLVAHTVKDYILTGLTKNFEF